MQMQQSACVNEHALRVTVTKEIEGWRVRHESDSTVIREIVRTDWHRVERDLWLFHVHAESARPDSHPAAA